MPRRRPWIDDNGSAALEFITAGVLLLVPFVYLIIATAAIQAGALSVEGASRQAARVFVQAPNAAEAGDRAQTAVEFALDDFGVSSQDAKMRVVCSPHPHDCLSRHGYVTVTVTASVPLPFAPPALGISTPLAVPLAATSTEQVSRFWGAG